MSTSTHPVSCAEVATRYKNDHGSLRFYELLFSQIHYLVYEIVIVSLSVHFCATFTVCLLFLS